MIYIVSGFMRTGTTMMMEALTAGGLTPLHPELLDEHQELPQATTTHAIVNPHIADNTLFKCMVNGVTQAAAWDWQIVVMQRGFGEILASYKDFYGPGQFVPNREELHALMSYSAGQMRNRRDMKNIVFQYQEVLTNPVEAFGLLKERGWPIDVNKAAAIVEPDKCHHRSEAA